MARKPIAISNWKMAMTIRESLDWVEGFRQAAADLLSAVDVVVCPPYTAIWAVAQALHGLPIQLGGQNIADTCDPARTGQISAALLADVGCRWVLLGYWEVRRHLHDDDEAVNRKVHLALQAGLSPILLIGEPRDAAGPMEAWLDRQLAAVLRGCDAEQVRTMAFVYEPEAAIGVGAPVTPDRVEAGCRFIRQWIRSRWGDPIAEAVRIIYGGSVAPEFAAELLQCPDVDGLGATRRGRDPASFAAIVRQVAESRAG